MSGVGLVLVSHSAALAAGLADLVGQMAPGVSIVAAGGTGAGEELGTSPDVVADAVAGADSGAGVVVLYDLGSARMSAELAGEFVDPELADRMRIVDAAFVEGALAAGVAAAAGQGLAEVAGAARGAVAEGEAVSEVDVPAAEVSELVVVADPAGLHARPAAGVVRAAAGGAAWVSVPGGGRASASSLTGLLRLSVPAGGSVSVSAVGPDAAVVVGRIVAVLSAPAAPVVAAGAVAGSGPVPAAPGRAVGALRRAAPAPVVVGAESFAGAAAERARVEAAVRRVADGLGEGEVAGAHRALLADPELVGAAYKRIEAGVPAAEAWSAAVAGVRDELGAVADELIASRVVDVVDVGQRVLGELTGAPVGLSVPAGSVLLADEVPPSLVASLVEQGVVAVVCRGGGARSHAAVLARAAGVPMVVAAGASLDGVADGTRVLVDGGAGSVVVDPPADAVVDGAAPVLVSGAVRRADGGLVRIAANVASVADARAASVGGAEGVGLLRTELLFTGRSVVPDEAEQVAWLSEILAACPPGPVVVRTVDLGGDKPVPGLGLDPVRHGFLGARGLRLCLARPELFAAHLRAVLRAGLVRPVEVMFPFVTEPGEVVAARAAVESAAASLAAEGVSFAAPAAVGMMVEIPAAAIGVAPFLPLVDFLSVGSNDLAQYLGAADRTLSEVAAEYRAGERLVPGLVAGLVAAARPVGVPVAVCGDLAGDAGYAAELVAAGVDELSVAPPLVARVRSSLLSEG